MYIFLTYNRLISVLIAPLIVCILKINVILNGAYVEMAICLGYQQLRGF